MTRTEALAIVQEYVKNQNLIRHMLAVEAAMRFYARKFEEDVEMWGITGLLHADGQAGNVGTRTPAIGFWSGASTRPTIVAARSMRTSCSKVPPSWGSTFLPVFSISDMSCTKPGARPSTIVTFSLCGWEKVLF